MTVGAWIMLIIGVLFLYGGLFWSVSIAKKSKN
ncbi:MetS family NSS transporter small subunit [Caloranaerobacter sp. TR13]|nr:MetS family NSS transporter small subunit [Caloranaerobacter sp. TR13]